MDVQNIWMVNTNCLSQPNVIRVERRNLRSPPGSLPATSFVMMPLAEKRKLVQRKYAFSFRLGLFEVPIAFCQNHTKIKIKGKLL